METPTQLSEHHDPAIEMLNRAQHTGWLPGKATVCHEAFVVAGYLFLWPATFPLSCIRSFRVAREFAAPKPHVFHHEMPCPQTRYLAVPPSRSGAKTMIP